MLSQRIARLFRTGGRKKTKQFFGVVGTAVADSNHSNEMQPWGRALQYTARRQLATYESRGLHAEFVESLSNVVHHFSGASFQLS